jgi:hypothetical protein
MPIFSHLLILSWRRPKTSTLLPWSFAKQHRMSDSHAGASTVLRGPESSRSRTMWSAKHPIISGRELTRNGGSRYWVFASPPTAPGTDEDRIYASVETLKKPVALKTRDGGFSIEWSHGIAIVFTPPEYRGKKIAAWMMRRLGEWLDTEEADCKFSVLHSDINVCHYERSPRLWLTIFCRNISCCWLCLPWVAISARGSAQNCGRTD